MVKYSIGRGSEVLGEFTAEEIKERIASGELLDTDLVYTEGFVDWKPIAEVPELQDVVLESLEAEEVSEEAKRIGSKRLVFLAICAGVSVLCAILTFWLSEAASRPPAVNDESPRLEWSGLGNALNKNKKSYGGGPVSKVVKLFGIREPVHVVVVYWIIFCVIVGIVMGLVRARSWGKRTLKDNTYDEPIFTSSLRSKIIYAALIMGFFIIGFEVRNGMRRNQRETNLGLLKAAFEGNVEAVKSHLAAGADVNVDTWGRELDDESSYSGQGGYTSLHLAAKHGRKEIVEVLISKGADVNSYGRLDEATALLYAAEHGHTDIVETLVTHGADVKAYAQERNAFGRQPGYTSLHWMAEQGHKDMVELLISKGADVDAKTKRGKTPLLAAAASGHKEIVEYFISIDADVNADTKEGDTPLLSAVWNGHKEIADLLISKGANVASKHENGVTPLHAAAEKGHKEIVELLIAKEADVEAKTNNGDTPLLKMAGQFFAVEVVRRALSSKPEMQVELDRSLKNLKEIIEMLTAKGANVNAKNKSEKTILHLAADIGPKEIVELLIAKGADVNAEDRRGRTPLDEVSGSSGAEITELLRKHGGKTRSELKEEGK